MQFQWEGIIYDSDKMGQLQIQGDPNRLILWTLDRQMVFKVRQAPSGLHVERIPDGDVPRLAALYRIPGLLP